jgi:hypothetical protein
LFLTRLVQSSSFLSIITCLAFAIKHSLSVITCLAFAIKHSLFIPLFVTFPQQVDDADGGVVAAAAADEQVGDGDGGIVVTVCAPTRTASDDSDDDDDDDLCVELFDHAATTSSSTPLPSLRMAASPADAELTLTGARFNSPYTLRLALLPATKNANTGTGSVVTRSGAAADAFADEGTAADSDAAATVGGVGGVGGSDGLLINAIRTTRIDFGEALVHFTDFDAERRRGRSHRRDHNGDGDGDGDGVGDSDGDRDGDGNGDDAIVSAARRQRRNRAAAAQRGGRPLYTVYATPQDNGNGNSGGDSDADDTAVTAAAAAAARVCTTGHASPVTVAGLEPHTAYTFTVVRHSVSSPPSRLVVSLAKRSAPPTNVTASSPLAHEVVVRFDHVRASEGAADAAGGGNDGGSRVTHYTVTSSTADASGLPVVATSSASPVHVTNLDPSKAYAFTVTAHNRVGASPPSEASQAVEVVGEGSLEDVVVHLRSVISATQDRKTETEARERALREQVKGYAESEARIDKLLRVNSELQERLASLAEAHDACAHVARRYAANRAALTDANTERMQMRKEMVQHAKCPTVQDLQRIKTDADAHAHCYPIEEQQKIKSLKVMVRRLQRRARNNIRTANLRASKKAEATARYESIKRLVKISANNHFGCTSARKHEKGICITGIDENDALAVNGVCKFDVLSSVQGKKITNRKDLFRLLEDAQLGDTVPLKLFRSGAEMNIDMVITPVGFTPLQIATLQRVHAYDDADFKMAMPFEAEDWTPEPDEEETDKEFDFTGVGDDGVDDWVMRPLTRGYQVDNDTPSNRARRARNTNVDDRDGGDGDDAGDGSGEANYANDGVIETVTAAAATDFVNDNVATDANTAPLAAQTTTDGGVLPIEVTSLSSSPTELVTVSPTAAADAIMAAAMTAAAAPKPPTPRSRRSPSSPRSKKSSSSSSSLKRGSTGKKPPASKRGSSKRASGGRRSRVNSAKKKTNPGDNAAVDATADAGSRAGSRRSSLTSTGGTRSRRGSIAELTAKNLKALSIDTDGAAASVTVTERIVSATYVEIHNRGNTTTFDVKSETPQLRGMVPETSSASQPPAARARRFSVSSSCGSEDNDNMPTGENPALAAMQAAALAELGIGKMPSPTTSPTGAGAAENN